ncbi:TetR family transcriptional regulator [Rhodococcus sp. NPDC003318]|uniref:TetR/AcrR family transcriptional regulator n=1 Tax=Rhodococcus sp. NPDC003318 TaxID=3364503 RepID=UPI0036C099C9
MSKRDLILAAARELFSDKGYERTTMRAIAARADVDPALIHHYFTNKNTLLMAALKPDIDLATHFADIENVDSVGTEFARRLLGYWEDNPDVRTRMTALLRVAMTHDDVAALLRDFQIGALRAALGSVVAADRPEVRLGLVATQIFGIGLMRYILRAPQIRDCTVDQLVMAVGPVIDGYLTGPLANARGRVPS